MKKCTQNEQEEHLSAWRNSGLTAVEYCKHQAIKVQTFYGWIKTEKKRKQRINDSAGKMSLIKVHPQLEQQPVVSNTVLLEYDKLKIHIPEPSLTNILAVIIPMLEASNVH